MSEENKNNTTTEAKARDTRMVETSGGHKVELLTFITGREKRAIDALFLADMNVSAKAGQSELSGKGALLSAVDDKELEIVLVSVDGVKDGVVDLFLDLPAVDCEEVRDVINEVTGKKKAMEENKN